MRNVEMEVLRGPFGTTTELLDLINNVAVREPLRRFAAQHYAVFVDRMGSVVLVVRVRRAFSSEKLAELRNKECPGVIFFVARAGYYTNEAELSQRIKECARTYLVANTAEAGQRVIDGRKILILDPDRADAVKK